MNVDDEVEVVDRLAYQAHHTPAEQDPRANPKQCSNQTQNDSFDQN